MDQDRVDRMRASLRQAKLDALVLRLPENIVMGFGVWPMNGFSYAVFTADDGPVALVAPSCEDEEMDGCWAETCGSSSGRGWPWATRWRRFAARSARVARHYKLARARIGYEGSFECVAPSHNAGEVIVPCESSIAFLKSLIPSARWFDATALLHDLRATKTEGEIARLADGPARCRLWTGEVPRVGRARNDGGRNCRGGLYGLSCPRGRGFARSRHVNVFPQVSTGPNAERAWRPIVTTGKRRLREGEVALLELAVCVDGFWADVTRVKAAGKPSPLQRDVFAAVKAAQQAATAAIAPGVEARVPHEAATAVLVEAGFEKYVVHLTGHGLGFRYHEPEPFLMPGNTMKLKVGHVCSVEPGLYGSTFGGIRLEDNVAVTADGVEVLTKTAKTI